LTAEQALIIVGLLIGRINFDGSVERCDRVSKITFSACSTPVVLSSASRRLVGEGCGFFSVRVAWPQQTLGLQSGC